MIAFHCILTALLVVVFYLDLTQYRIPNVIVGAIMLLFPVMYLMADMPEGYSLLWTLGVFAIVFAIGVFIFAMNWAGGGDVKLLAALSLWAGLDAIAPLILYMAILGGVLSLALIFGRPIAAKFVKRPESLPRALRYDEPLPYGLAIAVSFLIVLWGGDIPGLPFAL